MLEHIKIYIKRVYNLVKLISKTISNLYVLQYNPYILFH